MIMISVVVAIGEAELKHGLAAALARNQTFDQYINGLLMTSHQPQPFAASVVASEEWLTVAQARARARNPGDEFLLEDLFSDEEWELIPTHSVFGREFKKALEKSEPREARFERKTATNKAVYIRL
jgi:hypothetical protein